MSTSKPYVSKQFSAFLTLVANDVLRNLGAHAKTLRTTTLAMRSNSSSTAFGPNFARKWTRNAFKSNFCALRALYPSAVLLSATFVRCARKSRRERTESA